MLPSASASFPFRLDYENDCLKRAHSIEDTLLSAIRIFLLTRKGSRVGNNVGSFLPELLLNNIAVSRLPSLANELKTELITNFPGVDFLNVVMSQNLEERNSDLIVKISFSTANQTNIFELTLNMPSVFDSTSGLTRESIL